MKDYRVFDIIGPVMIGPSSSHTAGACRIARTAKNISDPGFNEVEFQLHGSFAETYKGHGTDKALLAGALGFDTDDKRIRNSFEIAEKETVIVARKNEKPMIIKPWEDDDIPTREELMAIQEGLNDIKEGRVTFINPANVWEHVE